MTSIRIQTPARLHFGLFAGPKGVRKFGGVGLMIDDPSFDISVHTDVQTTVHGADPELESRIHQVLHRLATDMPGFDSTQSFRVEVHRSIPFHRGLGSGTQLALLLAQATATLLGKSPSLDDLVQWTGRGKRSAIGCHGFQSGGLIVESGRLDGDRLSPLFSRRNLPPDWRVVCVSPEGHLGIHGDEEQSAFDTEIRFDEHVSARLVRWACVDLMSALDRSDYAAFGEILHAINCTVGECFSSVQGGVFANPITEKIINAIRQQGIPAVGQSSWGPTAFAIVPTLIQAENLQRMLKTDFPSSTVWIARPMATKAAGLKPAPALLVSVRSQAEAEQALASGVDVVDLKEPRHGSLGRLEDAKVQAIASRLVHTEIGQTVQWSAALGELSEAESACSLPCLESVRMFFKVGLAGEADRSDWVERFGSLAGRIKKHGGTLLAAAYADAERAQSPHWRLVLNQLVARFLPPVFLVDTFDKTRRLIDYLSRGDLEELIDRTHELGIRLALAGSLRSEDLGRLPRLPDIVAIRGAACRCGDRIDMVDGDRIREFRQALVSWNARQP